MARYVIIMLLIARALLFSEEWHILWHTHYYYGRYSLVYLVYITASVAGLPLLSFLLFNILIPRFLVVSIGVGAGRLMPARWAAAAWLRISGQVHKVVRLTIQQHYGGMVRSLHY